MILAPTVDLGASEPWSRDTEDLRLRSGSTELQLLYFVGGSWSLASQYKVVVHKPGTSLNLEGPLTPEFFEIRLAFGSTTPSKAGLVEPTM